MVFHALVQRGAILSTGTETVEASAMFETKMNDFKYMGQPERADLMVQVSVLRTLSPAPEIPSKLADIAFKFIGHPPAHLMLDSTRAQVAEAGLQPYLHFLLTSMIPAEAVTEEMIANTVFELKQQSAKTANQHLDHQKGSCGYMRDAMLDVDDIAVEDPLPELGGPSQQSVLKSKIKCEMESEVKIMWPGVGFIVGLISAEFIGPRQEWDIRSACVTNVRMLDYRSLNDESTVAKAQESLRQRIQRLG